MEQRDAEGHTAVGSRSLRQGAEASGAARGAAQPPTELHTSPDVHEAPNAAPHADQLGGHDTPAATAMQNPRTRRSSPAEAYLAVRKILEEVERQLTHAHAAEEQPLPSSSSVSLLPSRTADAAQRQRNAAARALRRVHWLAQWTENVLDAYPFVEDNAGVEGMRSEAAPPATTRASVVLEATPSNVESSLMVGTAGKAPQQTVRSNNSDDRCSRSHEEAAAAAAVRVDSVAAGHANGEDRSSAGELDGVVLDNMAKTRGCADEHAIGGRYNNEPVATKSPPTRRLNCDAPHAPPVERQLSFPSEHGLRAAAAAGAPHPHVSPPHELPREAANVGRRAAVSAASAFTTPAPPPPPIIPRDRPPLCRDVGAVHDVPSTLAEQRAASVSQRGRCAHCGTALPLPTVTAYEWCCAKLTGLCSVVRCGGGGTSRCLSRTGCCCRLCLLCRRGDDDDGDGGSGSGSSGGLDSDVERQSNGEARTPATPRSTSEARRADARHIIHGSNRISSDRCRRALIDARRTEREDSYGDNPELSFAEDDEAGERQGLLALRSAIHKPQNTHLISPPPSRSVTSRLKTTTASSTAAAVAARAAAHGTAGALFCVYEGVYLCSACFCAKPDTSAVPRDADRVIDPAAWQVRSTVVPRATNGPHRFREGDATGSVDNNTNEDTNSGDVSPVYAAVTHAADRLNRWWMSRQLGEDPPTPVPFAAPPPTSFSATSAAAAASSSLPPASHGVAAGTTREAAAQHAFIIPAHVLMRWDFTRYPVSARAAAVLQRHSSATPPPSCPPPLMGLLYDISAIHPALYTCVPALAAASRLRKRMCLLHAQMWWCARYRADVWGVDRGSRTSSRINGGERQEVPREQQSEKMRAILLQPSASSAAAAAPSEGGAFPVHQVHDATQPTASPVQAPTGFGAAPSLQSAQTDDAEEEDGDDADEEGKIEDAAEGATASRGTPLRPSWSTMTTPPPPRCTPKRRYLVERAEGWSLQDLYRLTTPCVPPAAVAAAYRASCAERVPVVEAPSLLGELQSMYAILQEHLRCCDYCRVHCRDMTTGE
ncbi:hypothetical protein ABB37_09728 [Leptomonas pyrrhocoris]|uniref:Rubicon Homology domain-containing protein n=1 Tax=Leptomonas pyrrhocoris TaxID=157538 RepID=A0A0M9FQ46_LEPPY|nr:hypothetical protein ABB37_09728 [Leptomonas pyrrhocoris]KPA73596.1 hypothetical protein ABB37_09728 [Leptomonas pyrrhocoris]|eukprot:XP_015652035.1 hypothetical protein ABB37_09728 [Leptomonas pyrrhocoris]